MLSVKSMSSGDAQGYFAGDDYYLQDKEENSWFGAGAAALGLIGTIDKNDFNFISRKSLECVIFVSS